MKTVDYQAVVFAGGRGSRMTELTSIIPKCLLPVANVPMIVYPLAMLQNVGFNEAIVLVPAKCLADVRKVIKEYKVQLKVELVEVSDDDDLGTAETLLTQHVVNKLTKNVLLVSCDFVCDFNIGKFLMWHESKESLLSVLFAPTSVQGGVPGPKTKRKSERDLIGIQSATDRLVFMCGESDLDEEVVNLHKNLLIRFPNIDFSTKLTDCHVYALHNSLINLLKVSHHKSSLKADFLPYVIGLQYQKFASLKPEVSEIFVDSNLSENDKIQCFAYLMKNDEFSMCSRLNTMGAYFETNKQILKILPKLNLAIHTPPVKQVKAQIGADSTLGSGSTVGDKCQVKRSVVGRECTLGDRSKVNNCLLMDLVRLGDGSSLANCIVCHSAEIGEKAELKDCFVGMNQRVAAGAKISAEIIGEEKCKLMEI